MSRLDGGSDVDLRTPFFTTRSKEGTLVYPDRSEIAAMLRQKMASSHVVDTELERELLEFEDDRIGSIGPMSMYLPWYKDGPKKAEAVFTDKRVVSKFEKDAWKRSVDRLQALIPTQSCILRSPEDAIRGEPDDPESGMDTTTNSGAPFWISPWKSGDGLSRERAAEVDQAFQWYKEEVKAMVPFLSSRRHSTNELPLWYCTAGQRLVQKGPEPFTPKSKRLVIAYPKQEAILARMATEEIMNALRKVRAPSGNKIMCAWFDLPTIDMNMQHILESASTADRVVNSGDISAFDATVPPWVLWDVGRAMATWVRGGQWFVWNLVTMMIARTVLITPTGFYGPGPSSMKSGSGLTNLLGSMANLTMQFYGEEIGLYKINSISVLGDDFVAEGESVNPDTTSETFSHFGMEAHPDKQFYKPNSLDYLQRRHILGRPGGIASVMRTLGSIMSLEKMQVKPKNWNKYAYVIQALSKLQNATFNPWFPELVNFVKQGDRLNLCANLTPSDVVTGGGNTGARLIAEDAQRSWKRLGEGVTFDQWSVNGVLRGETLPREASALFRRVYGSKDFTV
jgi:hypothetical protein